MTISTNAWLFLVSANRELEYRTLVKPDFAIYCCQKNDTFRQKATGNQTKGNQIRCREIREHDLTIIYQVKLVTNREICVASANSDDNVRDEKDRIIYLIEGIALKGLNGYALKSGELKISKDTFVDIHQKALKYYREFWGKTEFEFSGADTSSAFCLPTNNDKSEILEVEVIGEIYQPNTQISASEVNTTKGLATAININNDTITSKPGGFSNEKQKICSFNSPICSIVFIDNKLIVRLESQDLRVINTELDYQKDEWSFSEEFEIDKSGQYSDKKVVLNSQVVCSPRGDLIASAMTKRNSDNILLNIEEGLTTSLKPWIPGLAHPNRETVVIKIWDTNTKNIFKSIPILYTPTNVSLAFTSNGAYLAWGNSNKKDVEIWEIKSLIEKSSDVITTKANITAIAISKTDNVAITDSEGGLKLYNLPNENTLIDISKAHKSKINSVAFSPNSKYIVTVGKGGELKIWHTESDNPIKEIDQNRVEFNTVAFSPDGKYIATGDDDKTVKLWDYNGKLIRTFEGHTESVTTVAFSPDGKLASGSRDRTIRIWEYR